MYTDEQVVAARKKLSFIGNQTKQTPEDWNINDRVAVLEVKEWSNGPHIRLANITQPDLGLGNLSVAIFHSTLNGKLVKDENGQWVIPQGMELIVAPGRKYDVVERKVA